MAQCPAADAIYKPDVSAASRAEYDERMLPRVWWVDLETPEQREAALTWDGSYVVRTPLGSATLKPTFGPCVDLPTLAVPHSLSDEVSLTLKGSINGRIFHPSTSL